MESKTPVDIFQDLNWMFGSTVSCDFNFKAVESHVWFSHQFLKKRPEPTKVYQSLTICPVSWRMLFRHQCCSRFHGKIQRDQRKVSTRRTRWNRWKQRSGALMTEADNQRRTASSVQVWTSRLLGWKLDHFIYNGKRQGLKVIIIFLSRIQISQNCYYQTLMRSVPVF